MAPSTAAPNPNPASSAYVERELLTLPVPYFFQRDSAT